MSMKGIRRTQPVLTTHVPVRFPPELIAQVKELAELDNRTVSSWIRNLVAAEINRRTVAPSYSVGFSPSTPPPQ